MVAILVGIDLGVATLRLWQIQARLNEKDYITDVHLLPSWVADQEKRQILILRDLRRLNQRRLFHNRRAWIMVRAANCRNIKTVVAS
jgi:uncharacterized protein YecT (DUF1311 family)